MSNPVTTPAMLSQRRTIGLLHLILLLLGALAGTATFTAYLLRSGVPAAAPIVVAAPAPYRLLSLRGGQIWSVARGGVQQQVTHLDATFAGHVRAAAVSSDGKRVGLLTATGATERAWLLASPSSGPDPLPAPPSRLGSGPWHYRSIVWTGTRSLALLITGTAGITVVEQYSFSGAQSAGQVSWWRSRSPSMQALSLAPSGEQLALVALKAGTDTFTAQSAIRLQHLHSAAMSIAYHYLGTTVPDTVSWSPDSGTVAILIPGQGLAIQKSSGRPVLQVPDGHAPLAFSAATDAHLSYLSGNQGSWQLHVLALHGEADQIFATPSQQPPLWLGWTPDARALIYATGGPQPALWEIVPGSSTSHLITASAIGQPLATVAAGGPLAG